MPADSALPLTATANRANFFAWFVSDRNKRRRQAARAEDGQVISSRCEGTTLVELVNYGGSRGVETRTTPDSDSCPV